MTITDPSCLSSLAELFDSYRQDSNRDALGEVFDRTATRLLSFAVRRGYNRNEAEDLLQKTFLTAIERRNRYDSGRPLMLWLVGILNHEMHRFRDQRSRQPDPRRLKSAQTPGPFAALRLAELEEEIHKALESLHEPYRLVLELRLECDLSPQEIASRLQLQPGTVRVRLHRGFDLLRKALPSGCASALAVSLSPEQATADELLRLKSRILPDVRLAKVIGIKATTLLLLILTAAISIASLDMVQRQPIKLSGSAANVVLASPGSRLPVLLQQTLAVDVLSGPMLSVSYSLPDIRQIQRSLAPQQDPVIKRMERVSMVHAPTDELEVDPAVSWIQSLGEGPVGRYQAATVYDTVRHCAVLFGGYNQVDLLSDTWLFDGSSWSLAESNKAPPGRAFHSMAFDEVRGRAVLFGGHHGDHRLSDTWEFDGSEWDQRTPSTVPPARISHGMVYDTRRGVTVMFGGLRYYGDLYRDTWQWDGEEWLQIMTASAPSGRDGLRLVFDTGRGLVILFGGWDPQSNRLFNDTWEFDGVDWRQIYTAESPEPRHWHAMAYDRVRERTVLYGGLANGKELGDTWEFDGEAWEQIDVDAHAEPRAGHAMSFDSDRGVSVVHGGVSESGVRASTFEYPRIGNAAFEPFGHGCGCDLPPRLRLAGVTGPVRGQVFTLQVLGVPDDSLQVNLLVTIGLPELRRPLDLSPFGILHCVLYSPGGQVMFAERRGDRAVCTQLIPDRAELRGLSLTAQALMLSPSATNEMGLVLSNAGCGKIEPSAGMR